jgi:hypothetical protein
MLTQFAAEFFARSAVLAYPILALGLFLVVFLGVSLRALLTQGAELNHMANLPLFDDEVSRHD